MPRAGRGWDARSVDAASHLAVALGIGLLLGVERERHKGRGPGRGQAGARTFALTALAGGLCALIGPAALVVAGLAFVGAAALVGYRRSDPGDPGLTTEMALVVAYLLGVLARSEPVLAAGAAVAVTILLAERHRLHALARDVLTEQELHDGLIFAACALIVLPLVPDEGIGPGGALALRTVWLLVVIVMALQGAGYVALRTIGPRYGLLLVGLLGGFVSATATVATMAARARRMPEMARSTAAAGVVSSVATVTLLAIVVAAVDLATLRALALPLALAGAGAVGYAARLALRALQARDEEAPGPGRAFDLRAALLLAITVSAVLLGSAALEDLLGRSGVILAVAVAGFADAQAAAISAATLAAAGDVTTATAAVATLGAFTTNTVSKAALAVAFGTRHYAVQVWIGLAAMLAGAWAGWALAGL